MTTRTKVASQEGNLSSAPTSRQARRRLFRVPGAVIAGLTSGLVAITCCVSPVVLALFGVVTATEAVSLGDTLYYGYGWYFRGAGLVVAAVAFTLYLRQRNSCSLRGARRHKGAALIMVLSGAAVYAGLFWFTKYLGIWFG